VRARAPAPTPGGRVAAPLGSEASGATGVSGPRTKSDAWTVLDLLRWTTRHFESRGIPSARLDAEILLAFSLGVERLQLYIDFDKPLAPEERAGFRALVQRRADERVPVALLTGRKEFWSLDLAVSADVLVPRPETETLVSAAIDLAEGRSGLRILEIGTGSGAIALALAQELPDAEIFATDVSPAALEIAASNADKHGMGDRIRLIEGDLFAPVAGERFDLIVSNPPYLAEAERASLAPELAQEPDRALFAAAEGGEALRRLAEGAPERLNPNGALALELAPGLETRVAEWCRGAGLREVRTWRDLADRPRVVAGRLRSEAEAGAAPRANETVLETGSGDG
jgi:release factor glutamine methyltransferase